MVLDAAEHGPFVVDVLPIVDIGGEYEQAAGPQDAADFENPGVVEGFDMREHREGGAQVEAVVLEWKRRKRRALERTDVARQKAVHPSNVIEIDVGAIGPDVLFLSREVPQDAAGRAAEIEVIPYLQARLVR